MRKFVQHSLLLAFASPIMAMAQTEPVDQAVINRIRKEGLENSKVMDIVFNLTDMSGPRLANSPGYSRAANYAINTLKSFGVEKAELDAWGEFGKGWELEKSYMAMTAPYYRPIMIYPKTWTAGNKKLQNAEVLVISAKDSADLMKYSGQLKGKVIMMDQLVTYKHTFKADAVRYTEEELAKMEAATMAPARPVDTAAQRRQMQAMQQQRGPGGAARMMAILKEMAKAEGAVAMLSSGGVRSHDGTVFAQGGGAYQGTAPENFLDIALGIEDFNSILRIAKTGTEVKLDVDVKTKFHTKDLQGYNVIGEIPGTDPVLKNEIVMIGAHLDSWQAGTGATDNASGSAVMMEVMRILKALNISTKRTIRIGLWSAEEQGLWGSRGYVKKTFADPADMKLLPEHEKLSGYYNIDNGTGKIRGIYLQGNEACRNIFKSWLMPFKDLGAHAVTINNTGGTDHQSFDGVGLPGFQFIQDPIEYDTRTHHSNMDVYDHLIEDDLKQMATIVASFVYHTAQRDEKLPRKPLPAARPAVRR